MRMDRLAGTIGAAVIMVVPGVAAQSILDSPWVYFGVNTLILWAILFLIAKLIASNLTGNENTAVHVGIFAIAALLSWFLVGGGGFIWNVGLFAQFFKVKFAVNAAFITLVIFYGLRLFGMKVESKEGTVGLWILCIIFSGVVASSMDYFFWEAGTFRELLDLLFGPQGILTMKDNRLIIFVTVTVLLSWLFNDLKIGGEGAHVNKFNWIAAIIFGANIAASDDPISMKTLIVIAWITITIIIARGMWRGSR